MFKTSFLGIRELIRDRQRLTVFLVFLGLSGLIWLLISLGKTYNTTIMVPVKYMNFPENKTLLNQVPDQIAVNVAGSGYDLIKYDSRFVRDTLPVNIDNLSMSMWGEYQRGYLDASHIGKVLQQRAGGALSVNRVLIDTVSFIFDLKVVRTIPVKPVVDFSVAKGYVALDSGSVNPSEVEVYGALTLLDTLSFVHTRRLELGTLEAGVTRNVAIDRSLIGRDARLEQDSVTVTVKVDQLTEKRVVIEPKVLNVPDSLSMLIFPKTVEVSFQLPLSRFSGIEASDFRVEVDRAKAEGGIQVLPVELVSWPEGVRNVKVQPETVEFVLTHRE